MGVPTNRRPTEGVSLEQARGGGVTEKAGTPILWHGLFRIDLVPVQRSPDEGQSGRPQSLARDRRRASPRDRQNPAAVATAVDADWFPLAEQAAFFDALAHFNQRLNSLSEHAPDVAAATFLAPHGRWNGLISAVGSYVSGADLERVSVLEGFSPFDIDPVPCLIPAARTVLDPPLVSRDSNLERTPKPNHSNHHKIMLLSIHSYVTIAIARTQPSQ